MNQSPPPDSNPNQDPSHHNLQQNVKGSTVQGGIQGAYGNSNTQIQVLGDQIINLACNRLNIPLTQKEYRARQILLSRVKQFWVEDVLLERILKKTPYLITLVELDIEGCPDAVEYPFAVRVRDSHNQSQKLPPGTQVIEKFDEMGIGRTLLILGKPGSGKTTTLLRLAANIIDRVETDLNQLIPVVFKLSDWGISKNKTIDQWLIQELNLRYQIPSNFCETWVQDEQLLLLLDGLDELRSDHRGLCVQALREFRQSYGQTEIVLCSRIKDYKVLSQRLNFQDAICLQPLTINQINHYTARDSKLANLNQLLQTDLSLRELAENPLMLSLMTRVPISAIENLPKTASNEEYRKRLFNAYIKYVLEERQDLNYSKKQVKRWLAWLAWQMSELSQPIFLIEQMQPNLLQDGWQKWMYYGGVLIVSECIFMIITLITNAMNPKSSILVEDLVLGLLFGLMVVFRGKI